MSTSASCNQAQRPIYLRELAAAMVFYAGLLVASNALESHLKPSQPWLTLLALSPMLGCAAVAWVMLRAMRRMDELQLRVEFEALGLAFAGTALLTFGYGFLEGIGYPRLSMFGVLPLMMGCWALGRVVAGRRYA